MLQEGSGLERRRGPTGRYRELMAFCVIELHVIIYFGLKKNFSSVQVKKENREETGCSNSGSATD